MPAGASEARGRAAGRFVRPAVSACGSGDDTLVRDLRGLDFTESSVEKGFVDYTNGNLTLRVADTIDRAGVKL